MHNCEEFRERITELVIDREDLAARPEFQHEFVMCSSCSEFYAQAQEMIETLSGVGLTVSENRWKGIEARLCQRMEAEAWGRSPKQFGTEEKSVFEFFLRPELFRATTPFLLASAALLLITIGLSRFSAPVPDVQNAGDAPQAAYVEPRVPLDPVTVDFLEQSELLLRSVMKMSPKDVDDLADAKKVAGEQLAELDQRKEAAAEVPPVVDVMETYETVLRDIRNVDARSADEDIGDIQKRIEQNGLIANMKAFQPRLTEVGYSFR